jgi:iron(III) transport system substrate-binding protein
VLYSGQHPQTTQALASAFEHQSGIQVAIRYDDEDVLAQQIATEGAHSPADVFFTENSPPLEYLAGKGLLDRVDSGTLAQVPAAYRSPTGHWVGVSARVSVLVYNTDLLHPAQLPRSVLDLAKPRWKGKLGLAPSETDFQPVVTAVDRQVGDAATVRWLGGLKANAGSHLYPDNESLVAAVNSGQVALGVLNQYYWYRLRAEQGGGRMHSALATFAPGDPGYVVDVSGAGVVKAGPNPTGAQKFLAFLVSETGQQIIAHSTSFEYPVRPGVAPAGGQPPLDRLQPDPLTVGQLGDGAHAVDLLHRAQLL